MKTKEEKIWYTIDCDYYDLLKFLKETFATLSKKDQEAFKANGYLKKKDYCSLVDQYRWLKTNIHTFYRHDKHKLLMLTKNPIDEITEAMIAGVDIPYKREPKILESVILDFGKHRELKNEQSRINGNS
jgi:hypothetical protein